MFDSPSRIYQIECCNEKKRKRLEFFSNKILKCGINRNFQKASLAFEVNADNEIEKKNQILAIRVNCKPSIAEYCAITLFGSSNEL